MSMPLKSKVFSIFALAIVTMLLASGCRPATGITLAGSTSVQPFAELLAERYMTLHPGVKINVQGGGSSAGIKAVMSGTCDIGMSSRELTSDEQGLTEIPIAWDGLVLIVNPLNPVRNLSLNQVREIYSGVIKKWSGCGGPDWSIHLVAREEGSGSRSAFVDLAMGTAEIMPKAIVEDSSGAVREVIAGDKAAIGFISLGLVNQEVRAIDIDGIVADRQTIIDHSYKLRRRFLLLTNGPGSPEARQFIDFVLSPEGQQVLSAEGLTDIADSAGGGTEP